MANWARCRWWYVIVDPAKISGEHWAQTAGYGNLVTVGFSENGRGRQQTAQWSMESDSEGDITGGFKSGDSQVLSRSENMMPLEEKGRVKSSHLCKTLNCLVLILHFLYH